MGPRHRSGNMDRAGSLGLPPISPRPNPNYSVEASPQGIASCQLLQCSMVSAATCHSSAALWPPVNAGPTCNRRAGTSPRQRVRAAAPRQRQRVRRGWQRPSAAQHRPGRPPGHVRAPVTDQSPLLWRQLPGRQHARQHATRQWTGRPSGLLREVPAVWHPSMRAALLMLRQPDTAGQPPPCLQMTQASTCRSVAVFMKRHLTH